MGTCSHLLDDVGSGGDAVNGLEDAVGCQDTPLFLRVAVNGAEEPDSMFYLQKRG